METGTLLKNLGKFLVLGIFCILIGIFTNECKAQDTLVTIKTQNIENVNTQDMSYSFWEVSKDAEKIGDLKEKLDKKTADELTKDYGQPMKVDINAENTSEIRLKDGIYYAKAYAKDKVVTEIVPFIFQVSKKQENELIISPKIMLDKGSLKIFKYEQNSNTKLPLKGVKFALYKENEWQFVKFKNGIYTTDMDASEVLETDDKGEIKVSGLLPGKYKLREVAALDGYKKLDEDIELNIEANKTLEKEVENVRIPTTPPSQTPPPQKEQPPKKTFLSKTGLNNTTYLEVIGVLFLGGALFLAKKKYKK